MMGIRLGEAPMARRRTGPVLRVQVRHEATRLSGQAMADAFERLLPVVARPLAPRAGAEAPRSGAVAQTVKPARRR